MKKNKGIMLGILAVLATMVITLGTSYAIFTKDVNTTNSYQIKVGNFNFTIDNEANPISLTNAYPVSDTTGKGLTPYTFTLNNASGTSINYTMKFVPDSTNTLDASKVKVYLTKGTTNVGPKLASELTTTLDSGTIAAGGTLNFKLRMWLTIDATTAEVGKTFKGKIQVNATQATQ